MYTIVEDIVCDFLIRELRAFQVTGVMKTWNKLCEAVEKSSINECTYSLNSRSNSFSKVFRENGGNMFREHECVPFSFFPLPYGLTNLRKRNFIIWGAWLPPLSSVWTGKFVTKQSNTHTHTHWIGWFFSLLCYVPVCMSLPLLNWKIIVGRKALDSSLHVVAKKR